MTAHLTDAELRDFAAGSMSPEGLLTADDHLAGCESCRARAAAVNTAGRRIDSAHAALTLPAIHLSDEDVQLFVQGKLSADARAAAERHLEECVTCAAQIADLRAWSASAGIHTPRRILALAAALLLAAAIPAAVWLLRSDRQAESVLSEQRDRDLPPPSRSEAPTPPPTTVAPPSAAPAAPSFVSLVLEVPSSRAAKSGAPPVLTVPSGAGEVHIQLTMDEAEYASYEVSVQPVAGSRTFARTHLSPRTVGGRARVTMTMPAGELADGDYMITLNGEQRGGETELVAQLLFRVARPQPKP